MPKVVDADADVVRKLKSWIHAIIRMRMAMEDLTYADVAERLGKMGINEDAKNLANKVGRGELPTWLFVSVMRAIGVGRVPLGVMLEGAPDISQES
jgi:hypothetical protein